MTRVILSIVFAFALVAPAAGKDWTEQPVKARFQTSKLAGPTVQCLIERLGWLANPSAGPEIDGMTKIQFSSFGHAVSEIRVMSGKSVMLELRGVSGGRVRRSVQSCL